MLLHGTRCGTASLLILLVLVLPGVLAWECWVHKFVAGNTGGIVDFNPLKATNPDITKPDVGLETCQKRCARERGCLQVAYNVRENKCVWKTSIEKEYGGKYKFVDNFDYIGCVKS